MIDVFELTARTKAGPRVELGPVTFTLDAGKRYAFVGAPRDGVDLLLAVLAGVTPRTKGRVTVNGASPRPSRQLAYVPYDPELPTVLQVDEYLDLAAKVRGEPPLPAAERLDVLGVAPLARRRVRDLTLEECRAVALVEALTSHAPLILLVDALVELDPRAVGRVADVLRARARDGATVLLATASPADAVALAEERLTFDGGKLTGRTRDDDPWPHPPTSRGEGARLFVRSRGARFLLAELASDPTFQTAEGEGATLVVTGKDPVAMAAAVATAARHANAELDLMEFETPGRES